MAQIVKLKRTAVQGKVPTISNVELGELAMNTYDGRIFFEKSSSLESIQEILTTNTGRAITGSLNLNGAITASYFKGDGSALTNVTANISEQATVTGSFSNASSFTINHGFGSKNIIVSVYNTNNSQLVPQTVTLTDNDNVQITLAGVESGFAVVAKGGHIVSGSASDASNLNGQPATYYLNYNNLNNVPNGLVSGSSQITLSSTTGYNANEHFTQAQITTLGTVTNGNILAILPSGTISGSSQLTSTFDTRYLNTNGDSVVSGSSQIDVTQTTNYSSINQYSDTKVKTKLNAETVVSGSTQIDHDQTTNFVANEHIDHSSVSITAGDGLSGGGTIASTRTLAVDNTVLRTTGDGVVSGSSQITLSSTTGYNANEHFTQGNITTVGTVTSGNVNAILPSGVVSGSDQVASTFAQTILDDTSAGAVRTTIGVDAAGTDNSTDVTLAGSYDYLSLSGQQITLGQVDASTDISNLTTSNVTEGTNQYYTDTRVKTKLNAEGVLSGSSHSGNQTFDDDVVITGNLTVNGTTTSVNSNTVNIGDNIIVLNSDESGTPSQDAGIEVERGTSTNVRFQFKESTDRWQFSNDGSTYFNLPTSTADVAEFSNLYYTDTRVKTKLNTEGVVSGSSQVSYTGLSNIPSGIISGSSQVNANTISNFDSNVDDRLNAKTVISGSSQVSIGSTTGTLAVNKGGTGATTAAGARSNLGVDAAGTDNSTDVTLGGSYDYITISGQTITRNQINAVTDISNLTTANVSEVTNLYYTDARVKTKLTAENVVSGSDQITDLTTHKETVSGASSYAVDHNLDEQYPIVQAWNTGTSQQEVPLSITTNSANRVTVVFSTTFAGIIIVKK